MGGRLCLRLGRASSVVPRMAEQVGAEQVHVTNDFGPYGRARDRAVVEATPGNVEGVATGHAVRRRPGHDHERLGQPLQGVHAVQQGLAQPRLGRPAAGTASVDVGRAPTATSGSSRCSTRRCATHPTGCRPPARTLAGAASGASSTATSDEYDERRDQPGADRTSRLSPYLKYGVVHPRQLLAETASRRSAGARTFENELAWRDFYADVLFHNPESAWKDLNRVPGLTYDDPADAIEAWKQGTTGFPIVDAGMRQLLSEGWMHNRVRMITASFLDQGPARLVACRRAALPRPPRRRRPRLQQPRLAVGRGHRHRRGAVLPRLQPGDAGARSSTPRATTSAAGSPSWRTCPARRPTSRGTPRTATRTATRAGSSTTRRSVAEALDRYQRGRS